MMANPASATQPVAFPQQKANMSKHVSNIKPNSQLAFREGTLWMTAYQRNNKSKGQKNLRCFPACTEKQGHQKGFCGRHVTVEYCFKLQPDSKQAPTAVLDKLLCFAQFLETDQAGFQDGDVVPRDHFHDRLRTAKRQLGPYIEGERQSCCIIDNINNTAKVAFEYNRDLKGWHYGFQGSKRTRNMFHTFTVYICQPVRNRAGELEGYEILQQVSSPRWQIFCRRRKTAPIPVLVKDKSQASGNWNWLAPKDKDATVTVQLAERKPLGEILCNTGVFNQQRSKAKSVNQVQPSRVVRQPSKPKPQPKNHTAFTSNNQVHNKENHQVQFQQQHHPRGVMNQALPFSPMPGNTNYPFLDSPMFGGMFQSPVNKMKRPSSQRDFYSPRTELTGEFHQKRNLFRQDQGEPAAFGGKPLQGFADTPTDSRFEQLKQLLSVFQIPSPSTAATQMSESIKQIAPKVCKFIQHCRELQHIPDWAVPFPFQLLKESNNVVPENAMSDSERQSEYALFLTKQRGFLEEVVAMMKLSTENDPEKLVASIKRILGQFTSQFSSHIEQLVARSDDEFTSASQSGFDLIDTPMMTTPGAPRSRTRFPGIGASTTVNEDTANFSELKDFGSFLSPTRMSLTPARGNFQARSPGEHSLVAGFRGSSLTFGIGASPGRLLMESSPFRIPSSQHTGNDKDEWKDATDQDFEMDFAFLMPPKFDRLSIENSTTMKTQRTNNPKELGVATVSSTS